MQGQFHLVESIFYICIMNKTTVIETLDNLPNEFSTEELMDRLLFIDKVERGMKDAKESKVISLEEAKTRMDKKWLK